MKESDTIEVRQLSSPEKVPKAKAHIRPPSRDSHLKGRGPSASSGLQEPLNQAPTTLVLHPLPPPNFPRLTLYLTFEQAVSHQCQCL